MVLALLTSATFAAQKKKDEDVNVRSVQGVVTDQNDKPVPQAVVQLKDMRSLQVRSFITEDDGSYHFSGLRTEVDYQLQARSQNMMSAVKTFSVFDTRKVGIYNLKLDKK